MIRSLAVLAVSALAAISAPPVLATSAEIITVDAAAPGHPFPHYWERMFGSGRAALSLRDSYRHDLRTLKGSTAVAYVRFHGILHDELGVYDENKSGQPVYNFSYVDSIYDGLLATGVRPLVELSFMPNKLARQPMPHSFWYKPNISPPKSYERWDALITALARHVIERYGIDEVATWYFEVWNEPNLDFWGGLPRQSSYWELYDHTAAALKAVDGRLRVGGPASAQAAWISEFIRHCADNKVPVDFVSTHVYANDKPEDVFGTQDPVPRNRMVCRAVRKVHDEIKSSAFPKLPLIWSEFNASFANERTVTDSMYMGPWLADTIRQCDGLVDELSYWTFSDVFEEQGVVKTPFYGGYGLIAAGGIPKPAFNAFALLHRLGEQRLEIGSDAALLTRRADGALVLALWNYAPPGATGPERQVVLRLRGSKAKGASIVSIDPAHGDVQPAYERMGSPRYPTVAQIAELKSASALPPPTVQRIVEGTLRLVIAAHGLTLVTFE